jgi:hypothetical protein
MSGVSHGRVAEGRQDFCPPIKLGVRWQGRDGEIPKKARGQRCRIDVTTRTANFNDSTVCGLGARRQRRMFYNRLTIEKA